MMHRRVVFNDTVESSYRKMHILACIKFSRILWVGQNCEIK